VYDAAASAPNTGVRSIEVSMGIGGAVAISAGSWHDHVPQPGDVALGLLGPEWTAAIINELATGPLRPAALKRQLPGAAHATLMARLKNLTQQEIIVRECIPGSPLHVVYALTERGRQLVDIVAEAARVERQRPSAGDRPAGERILRLIASRRSRAIGRTLAHGPLTEAEIERSLPGVPHSSLERCLGELVHAGAVSERRERPSHAQYELSAYGRRLTRLVLLAAQWERRWLDPDTQPQSDVGGLVHLIAPLARIAPALEGACRLHVLEPAGEPPVDISVATGRISALPLAPTVPIEAHARAGAREWGRALLESDPSGITVEGSRQLFDAAIVALGAALQPPRHKPSARQRT
jgi:DNA-binding HxlR family transcriptional regulator